MSINATVQRLVDDLFADKLVAGLEATEKITWKSRETTGYSPMTGEVSSTITDTEVAVITGDMQSGFPSGVSASETGNSLGAADEVVLQMQPMEGRNTREALGDSFVYHGKEYAVKNVEVIRLGSRPMLWKVVGA
jgi:hypothetical protein